MLITDTDTLQIELSEAHTTAAVQVYVVYTDGENDTLQRTIVPSNGTTVQPILSNGPGRAARIRMLAVYNDDTVSHGVTLSIKVGVTTTRIYTETIAAGYTLQYIEGRGFISTTSGGAWVWGGGTGLLSDQADLQAQLDTKLAKASNLSDLTNAATARANLGGVPTLTGMETLTNKTLTNPALTANTTTQRDALSPVEGQALYNSTTKRLDYYDGTFWGDLAVDVSDDFVATGVSSGTIGQLGWGGVGTGTIKGNEAKHVGIFNLATATTGHLYLNYVASMGIAEFDGSRMTFVVRLPSIVSVGAFCGVAYVNSVGNGRKGFYFDPALSANWRVMHETSAGVKTFEDTGIAATTGWVILALQFDAGTSTTGTAKTLSGSGSATNTGAATQGSAGHCPQLSITSGSGTKSIDIDFFRLRQPSNRL